MRPRYAPPATQAANAGVCARCGSPPFGRVRAGRRYADSTNKGGRQSKAHGQSPMSIRERAAAWRWPWATGKIAPRRHAGKGNEMQNTRYGMYGVMQHIPAVAERHADAAQMTAAQKKPAAPEGRQTRRQHGISRQGYADLQRWRGVRATRHARPLSVPLRASSWYTQLDWAGQ